MSAEDSVRHALRCISCGYDIASLVELRGRDNAGVCPECGSSIGGMFQKRIEWLPRCLRCGHDVASLREQGDAGVCPECSSPTLEVFRQRSRLDIYERVTVRHWFRMICSAVRSPSGFMLTIDQKRELTSLLAIVNAVICAVVLGGVPTATLAMTIEWKRWNYRILADDFEGPLWMAWYTVCLAGILSIVAGALWTALVVRKVGRPTTARVFASGVLFASCWAVAWAVALAPFGVVLGLRPPPWGEPPAFAGVVWICGVLLLVPVGIAATCFGIWKLRYLNPGRVSASERPPASNLP